MILEKQHPQACPTVFSRFIAPIVAARGSGRLGLFATGGATGRLGLWRRWRFAGLCCLALNRCAAWVSQAKNVAQVGVVLACMHAG
jgi:hypothetical protein